LSTSGSSESSCAADGRNFAIIGVAGYVAPRHLRAIKATGGRLVAALDKSESVGIMDSYFPEAAFFTEFERFDRHIEKLRRMEQEKRVHYVSICSPNYLHDAHIRFALRLHATPICEKPLVINPWNLDALQELEQEFSQKVYCVLQLRLHPTIIALREQIANSPSSKRHQVELTYVTSRGKWYFTSWKGNVEKSGGIATNIGVHFFDMLMWIFGKLQYQEVHYSEPSRMAGFLALERADVKWFLSVDCNDLPGEAAQQKKPTYRSIAVDGAEVEFSEGFTDLHNLVYEDILSGRGFGIEEVRPSIRLVFELRTAQPQRVSGPHVHPLLASSNQIQGLRAG
jgi:UDP-N-acetyl-2-amino-2-deoxyglucuronate dehydrogenase